MTRKSDPVDVSSASNSLGSGDQSNASPTSSSVVATTSSTSTSSTTDIFDLFLLKTGLAEPKSKQPKSMLRRVKSLINMPSSDSNSHSRLGSNSDSESGEETFRVGKMKPRDSSAKSLAKLKSYIVEKVKDQYADSFKVSAANEELERTVVHIVKEIAEVVSFTPMYIDRSQADQDEAKEVNPLVVLHYDNKLVKALSSVCLASADHGYTPQHIVHIKKKETIENSRKATHLDGNEDVFDINNAAAAYIPICYSSSNSLQGNALRAVLNCYAENNVKDIVVYLGTDDGLEENKIKKSAWIANNQNLLNDFTNKNVRLVHRENGVVHGHKAENDWVATPAYQKAEEVVAKISDKIIFRQTLGRDVVDRLQLKGIIPQKEVNVAAKKNKSPQVDAKKNHQRDSSPPAMTLPAASSSSSSVVHVASINPVDPVMWNFQEQIKQAGTIEEKTEAAINLATYVQATQLVQQSQAFTFFGNRNIPQGLHGQSRSSHALPGNNSAASASQSNATLGFRPNGNN